MFLSISWSIFEQETYILLVGLYFCQVYWQTFGLILNFAHLILYYTSVLVENIYPRFYTSCYDPITSQPVSHNLYQYLSTACFRTHRRHLANTWALPASLPRNSAYIILFQTCSKNNVETKKSRFLKAKLYISLRLLTSHHEFLA